MAPSGDLTGQVGTCSLVMTASMLAVRFASAVFGLVQYVSVTGSKSRLPAG